MVKRQIVTDEEKRILKFAKFSYYTRNRRSFKSGRDILIIEGYIAELKGMTIL